MLLGDAQTQTTYFCRNGGVYASRFPAQLDYAIWAAADRFIRETRCLPRVDQITLTNGTAALPAFPTTFRPDRLITAYLTGSNVKVQWVGGLIPEYAYNTIGAPIYAGDALSYSSARLLRKDYQWLSDLSIARNISQQPALIAFDTWTTGLVYPNPDDNYTLNLRWTDFFTSWTYGSGSPSLALNLPDDMLSGVLMFGAPGLLLSNEPEHAKFGEHCLEQFELFIQKYAGVGNLGAEDITPEPVRR
jgi:hypothetical protein